MDKTHSDLAHAWIENCKASYTHGVESDEAESTWWAYEKLEQLVDYQPNEAMKVILEIMRVTDDDRTLSNLAAGPLETLLVKHGKEMIDKINEHATSDSKFIDLLQGVWGYGIDQNVWCKIKRGNVR